MERKQYTAYRSRIINPLSSSRASDIRDGLLIVDKVGCIVFCGSYADAKNLKLKLKIIDLRQYLLIPGLIDCHLHLPQLDCRGKHGETLLDWLKRYIFPAEAAFKDPKIVDDVGKRFFKKLILNGTTTASIYVTVHSSATDHAFKLAKQCGIRAIIGKVMMDQNVPEELVENTKDSLRESEKLAAKWHNSCSGRLRYAFTPRFVPTCSKLLLKEIGKLASQSDTYIQSHIAETREENANVKKIYPEYTDYFSIFEDTGTVGPKTILGHAIYLSDSEFKRMAASKTKIAHCPTSNLFLKSGKFPFFKAEKAGVFLGLGTDVGAGTSMCLFSEMRHADYTQLDQWVDPVKGFYLATLGGAAALSMGNEIGNFKHGKWADFIVLDIRKIDYHYKLSDLTTDEVLSLLMYRGTGAVVKFTYVSGKKLDVDSLKLFRRAVGY